MDIDAVEQRYLITAAADSTIEAFDVLVSLVGLASTDCLPAVVTIAHGSWQADADEVV